MGRSTFAELMTHLAKNGTAPAALLFRDDTFRAPAGEVSMQEYLMDVL
jgi:hypothetical protein